MLVEISLVVGILFCWEFFCVENHVSFLDGVTKLAGVNFHFLLSKWSCLLNCFSLVLVQFGVCVQGFERACFFFWCFVQGFLWFSVRGRVRSGEVLGVRMRATGQGQCQERRQASRQENRIGKTRSPPNLRLGRTQKNNFPTQWYETIVLQVRNWSVLIGKTQQNIRFVLLGRKNYLLLFI